MAYDFNSFSVENNEVCLSGVENGIYSIGESIGWLDDSLNNSLKDIKEELYNLSALENLESLECLTKEKGKE